MAPRTDRLGFSALADLPAAQRPLVDPRALGVGIAHLGIGAFHRAHQAVFTEEAIAAAGGDWGICGVTQRSRGVLEQLQPQDGLYSVLVRGEDTSLRVAGAVRDLLFVAEEGERLQALLAAPTTRLVTLTVTEKGYRHDPATGRLRRTDPDVAADLAGDGPPRTVVGQLVRGLQARRAADAGPITLLSCDNLPANGEVLRGLVTDFCAALPDGESLATWIAESVSFPSSMVDRIVPATTDDDRAEAAKLLGFSDRGVVVTEPFRQWVVEDHFAAGRPAWEHAGAVLTADVAPYEAMKLRLLNGSHSTLAYLGALAGHAHVADAMADPGIAGVVAHLMAEDVEPTLAVPDGYDVAAYQRELIERFHNPALRHRTVQIAMDGTQKLPQRLLGTIADRLAAGAEPRFACLGVAAWMRYVWTARAEDGAPLPVDDPLAERLRELTADAATPQAAVDALLSLEEVFGAELPANDRFCDLVTDALEALTKGGVAAATQI
ncbi:fructuronate reductase [Pseudonocardia hierapolitana]|uniref:Mannitol-1-phosphate 5-dehydrogenase n=1 Tax=Pseudonocardia hierapolitana TaxID=1128676 RepID=A0A561T3U8_9PSEU|nr:mannitol dehydrogenase family protein [Pseudonocardia hierapolitana]TWF81784.1 fructuronate reductase [Pseudonocardia hierapolitana]